MAQITDGEKAPTYLWGGRLEVMRPHLGGSLQTGNINHQNIGMWLRRGLLFILAWRMLPETYA